MKGFILFLLLYSQSGFSKNVPYQDIVNSKLVDCQIKKKVHYLTKQQEAELEKSLGKKLHSKIFLQFKGQCKEKVRYVYIDSHLVRTLNETVVATISDNQIEDYSIASFMEPMEYRPSVKWLAQMKNRNVKSNMQLYQDIDGITGATLSARATINTVKKLLILHQILIANDVKNI